jgi:hypothetical protein
MEGNLTERDHVNMDAFIGHVLDDYKSGTRARPQIHSTITERKLIMKTHENNLIVGAVVSTSTTSLEDIKSLANVSVIDILECSEITAQMVFDNCTTHIILKS